jgi:hypothetical protein
MINIRYMPKKKAEKCKINNHAMGGIISVKRGHTHIV